MWTRAFLIACVRGPCRSPRRTCRRCRPNCWTCPTCPKVAAPGWLSDTVDAPHADIGPSSALPPEVTVMPLGGSRGCGGPAARVDHRVARVALGGVRGRDAGPAVPRATGAGVARDPVLSPKPLPWRSCPLLPMPCPTGRSCFWRAIDMLLGRGALDPAQALIERAGAADPEVFRRWFDVALLTGSADRACQTMAASPDIAPHPCPRAYCASRAQATGPPRR